MWCATRPQAFSGNFTRSSGTEVGRRIVPPQREPPLGRHVPMLTIRPTWFRSIGWEVCLAIQQEGCSGSWNSLQTKPLGHPADHAFQPHPAGVVEHGLTSRFQMLVEPIGSQQSEQIDPSSPFKRAQGQADACHDGVPGALLLLRIHKVETVNRTAAPFRKVATAV